MVIGSRGSKLALWQARWIQARLEGMGISSRMEIIQTSGDKITDVALAKVGTKGLFTKEIEEALLDGRIDLAVHSLKDLPADLPPGLTIAAVPEREDARDVIVGAPIPEWKPGARIGTSSIRRAAQLRALRPDVSPENIRGNVDTRLRKLDEGQFAAILLAAAGLRRLGWADRIAQVLEAGEMCPAVGQGALAVESRDDGGPAFEVCRKLDHRSTRAAVTAERALLAALGGGCQLPAGAHARVEGEALRIDAVVVSPDGLQVVRGASDGHRDQASSIGAKLGERLLREGGRRILEQVLG